MRKTLTVLACFSLAMFFFTGCIVSKKKYDKETARANKERDEKNEMTNRFNQAVAINNKLNGNIRDLKNENASLNNTIGLLRDSIALLEGQIHDLEGNIHDLKNKNSLLGNQNQDANEQLNMTKAEIAAQRKHLEQLQAMIDQQQKAAEALRKKIADALTGFNSNELTVTMKNGKVYISMQEGLLFPSGSAVVNPKGKDALSKVASVLNTSKDINIDIEGHTDSLPIHTKMYEDNWALSTARATSIAHVLIDEYHVVPAKLVASGRSEYDPVATNATPQGRALNRRTEIILEPKLDELMQLLNSPSPKAGK
jgi:chemotaxis protein MotB